MDPKLAVVALGGNALLRGEQIGTIEEQEQNTYDTLKNVIRLVREGYDLVITHGNGPQVGNILMRNDAGEETYKIPQMPLDVCVADSQGGIGYMIERMLRNVLKDEGIQKEVATLVTPVEVNFSDPAFTNPTKRVGKIYTREQADQLHNDKKWIFKEEVKEKTSGWRRVVPSPNPIRILNEDVVKNLAKAGYIVIAVGGGGVPVYIDNEQNVRPAEAVIDKDLASALLAARINADEFYILTDVPFVYLNYKKPDQLELHHLLKSEADKMMADGVFGEGSMAPKIKAALRFVENGGKTCIITEANALQSGSAGTRISLD
jgi:carbamate kinase